MTQNMRASEISDDFETLEEMKVYGPTRLKMETMSPDRTRRFAAAKILHLFGDADTAHHALALTGSAVAEHREVGAFLLGQLGTASLPVRRASVRVLSQLLTADDVADVRAEAAAALGHLKSRESVEVLCLASADSDPDVRANSAFALGRIGGNRAKRVLHVLSRDEDHEVREWAALGLKSVSTSS